ncbi:MAG TPA: hypothetical protein VGK67_17025 [Myxococcales bacterium]|jgi:hypothetical protein
MSRAAVVLAASTLLFLAAGCAKGGARPSYAGPPKAFKLLTEVPEAETGTRLEKRSDLFVTVENGEPVPFVVAVGEVPNFNRQGGAVKLYGDEAGKEGWSVDNFVFIEVVNAKGVVVGRGVIGYQHGLTAGQEQVDSLGQMKFAFNAGEIDLAPIIPANEVVTLKATALDSGGVGRVSNLFAILSSDVAATSDDEMRN